MKDNLKTPIIEWRANAPVSLEHDDVYFCGENGLAETRMVFIDGNNLAERFAECRRFVIAETGFGTGLNFLATWQLWRECAPADAILHFFSVEQMPLSAANLARAHQAWPELADLSKTLVNAYVDRVPGFHRLWLDEGCVCLTLCFGEATQQLTQFNGPVDAWFLDGFAPARNPDMWSDALFEQVARTTRRGGTFATFTAAGFVRRGLEAVGFNVERRSGFGKKRERLIGQKTAETMHPSVVSPWFRLPDFQPKANRSVAIIGAGLAGCACANRLASRGYDVTLMDSEPGPAQAASGNLMGIAPPLLSADYNLLSRFVTEGFRFFGQSLDTALGLGVGGVIQLAFGNKERDRQRRLMDSHAWPESLVQACSAHQASQLCGVAVPHGGLYFPQAKSLNPLAVCQHWLTTYRDRIDTLFGCAVEKMFRQDDQWRLMDSSGQVIHHSDVVILSNGSGLKCFGQSESLPTRAVRGQVSHLTATETSTSLAMSLCFGGYLTPAADGIHCLGATYDQQNKSLTLNPQDHRVNLEQLGENLPELAQSFDVGPVGGRAAFRTTTPDRLPLIGPLPNDKHYRSDYHDLSKGRAAEQYPNGRYWPSCYVSAGHGSRGLVSTLLAGEILACQINQEPLPIEQDLLDAVHPARFLIRSLKRQR